MSWRRIDTDGEGSSLNRNFVLVMYNMYGGMPMDMFIHVYNWKFVKTIRKKVSTLINRCLYPTKRWNRVGLYFVRVEKLMSLTTL